MRAYLWALCSVFLRLALASLMAKQPQIRIEAGAERVRAIPVGFPSKSWPLSLANHWELAEAHLESHGQLEAYRERSHVVPAVTAAAPGVSAALAVVPALWLAGAGDAGNTTAIGGHGLLGSSSSSSSCEVATEASVVPALVESPLEACLPSNRSRLLFIQAAEEYCAVLLLYSLTCAGSSFSVLAGILADSTGAMLASCTCI